MTISLVDTHCHLTELDDSELKLQIERASAAGVQRMICIGAGYGVEAAKKAVNIAERYFNIWASVGIHPHDAMEVAKFSEIELLALHPRVVAIGETGLDYFRDWSPVDLQKELFLKSIALAKQVRKPLIIHSREAGEDSISFLENNGASEVGGVYHCYSENVEFAKRLRKMNFLVSFPGSLTFKKADALRQIAAEIGLEQIMLETDAPYMAPEPFRGGKSEPAHVRNIAEVLAKAVSAPLEETASKTTTNAERLFRLI